MKHTIEKHGAWWYVYADGLFTIATFKREQDARDFAALPELVEAAKEYLALLESDYTGKHDYSNGAIGRITALLEKMGRKP